MPDHTYKPGDLVERISTGERATYCGVAFMMRVTCEKGAIVDYIIWPGSDCRPVVNTKQERERFLPGEKDCSTCAHHLAATGLCVKCGPTPFKNWKSKLRAAAEGGE